MKCYNIWLFFICYIGVIFIADVAEYYFDIPVWNQTTRTANCYNWFEQYLEKNYDHKNGTTKDYSEGIFYGNYSTTNTLDKATINKYEYIYNTLGLQPGMTLLDAGCGTGKWIEFSHNRGIDVIGLTLSEEQAKEVAKKGLKVLVKDYRIYDKDFVNRFDRITALGSSEHVCASRGIFVGNVTRDRCNKVRIETWKLFNKYLKPHGKVYITLLTTNNNTTWNWWDWIQGYILERHYGGYYFTMDDIVNVVVPETGFKITNIQDKTRDYHWSSVVDKDHFGHWYIKWHENPWNKIKYMFTSFMTDPHFIHHWLYYFMDTWMWQFGGYQETPLTDTQVSHAIARLHYFMLVGDNCTRSVAL